MPPKKKFNLIKVVFQQISSANGNTPTGTIVPIFATSARVQLLDRCRRRPGEGAHDLAFCIGEGLPLLLMGILLRVSRRYKWSQWAVQPTRRLTRSTTCVLHLIPHVVVPYRVPY